MSHKGKFYRVEGFLRMHNLQEAWPFWIPHQVRCTVQTWTASGVVTPPPTPTVAIAEWTGGGLVDEWTEFQSPDVPGLPYSLKLGFRFEWLPNRHQTATTFQIWLNGAKQQLEPLLPWPNDWMFNTPLDRGHIPGADLYLGVIGGLLEAVTW